MASNDEMRSGRYERSQGRGLKALLAASQCRRNARRDVDISRGGLSLRCDCGLMQGQMLSRIDGTNRRSHSTRVRFSPPRGGACIGVSRQDESMAATSGTRHLLLASFRRTPRRAFTDAPTTLVALASASQTTAAIEQYPIPADLLNYRCSGSGSYCVRGAPSHVVLLRYKQRRGV